METSTKAEPESALASQVLTHPKQRVPLLRRLQTFWGETEGVTLEVEPSDSAC